ncbi:MAG: chlorite dismutase family protein [Rubrobacteraceae bacterium]|uniref:chlorite dismutase family protein n=1 Tax=Rubrobacter naiadicus TaxID=1392641 RepID=UPI002360B6EF|nr:chlorite dismutase family protein [Rubrobacter naiadicus]MBX6763517.1 chlorite dismutase family protein [Rubrobacteraceae bacterium]MCL6438920.1 chlorite dismutase family protein [Rubrobacteraceae bacterium]
MAETTTQRYREQEEENLPVQYVNYAFFKLDPLWRRLPEEERERGKQEFLDAAESGSEQMILRSYSLLGLRSDADFMLWRIAYDLDAFEKMTGALLNTGLGKYLSITHSYFAISRRSIYVGEHTPGFENKRYIVPGEGEYLFVYPFVKRREWYRLPLEERQRMMNEHMKVGRAHYPIKNNTAYCFGIGDYEFILSFEAESPKKFQDLMMDLRETEASSYTELDTPIFTCRRRSLPDILDFLG